MALTDEDLKFTLTVDPDTAKMQAAIKDIGKDLDTQTAHAKAAWGALSDAGAKQLESLQANQKVSAGFSGPADPRAAAMKAITRDMERQQELLQRINAEMDPQVLRDRVSLEKQLADARESYLKAHDEASGKSSPGGIRGFLESLISGKGVNVRQLAGSAIGGAIGGGPSGALGAAAGGAGALGPLGVTAGVAAGGVLLAVDAIGKMTGAVKGLANEIAQFAGVASPAALYRWDYTVRDFEGVIGRRMIPILDALTDGLRGFANVLDAVLPSASKMQELTSELKGFFDVITFGVFGANGSKEVLKGVLQGLTGGILGSGSGDSFGAAARPAHFSGVEEFEKGFEQSALSASSLQGSIPEKQLTVLEQIRDAITHNDKRISADPLQNTLNMGKHGQSRALFGW